MSILVCNNCEGYYELQDGESPEDFDICQCGGTLKHYENMFEYQTYDKYKKQSDNSKNYEKQQEQHNNALLIHDAIKNNKKSNYFQKRDVKMDSNKSENLITNSAFILLTFSIFPFLF